MTNFNNLPSDIIDYKINGYVQDLLELDHKKNTLKTLAEEAKEEMGERFEEIIRWESETMYYAEEYVEIGMDEEKHGPSGDRGEYVCHNLKWAEEELKACQLAWNLFVEDWVDFMHLAQKPPKKIDIEALERSVFDAPVGGVIVVNSQW